MPHTIIAIFRSISEAHAAQVTLDAEAIDSEIGNASVTSADPFAPLRAPNVQLLVPREQAANAQDVLRAGGYGDAVERVERQKNPHADRTWPRLFQFGGLIVAATAVILMLTTDHPDAWTLLGLGVLLWGIGLLGRPRRSEADGDGNR